MTKGVHNMHALAERMAINMGPRVSRIDGQDRMAYFLSKKELKGLFARNGFNTNGIPWLKMICEFIDTWEEVGPSAKTILDKDETNWRIYFVHLNQTDLTELKMNGEVEGYPILAVEA